MVSGAQTINFALAAHLESIQRNIVHALHIDDVADMAVWHRHKQSKIKGFQNVAILVSYVRL